MFIQGVRKADVMLKNNILSSKGVDVTSFFFVLTSDLQLLQILTETSVTPLLTPPGVMTTYPS